MNARHRRRRTLSPSRLLLRGLAPLVLCLGTLAWVLQVGVGAAHAAPESDEVPLTPVERLMADNLRAREKALAEIDRKAAAWSRVLAARAATFAAHGYTGDVEDATHILPLASYRMSAAFGLAGPLWEHDHTGQDFGADSGTPLVALADAVVTDVGDAGPYGLRTILTLEDGTEVWYCHQSAALVAPGETLELAEPIGQVGSTGNSTGPHLHLEVRPDGGPPVDPVEWFHARGVEL